MRIGDLARMAGTTARAIRHYHRAGVLPEPARSANGYRRYEVVDLVRVTRIRWLLASGLSLREVAAVLDEESAGGTDLEQELHAALDRVVKEQARLAPQEQMLRGLLAQVRAGREPSALADDVMQGLGAVADAIGPGAGVLLENERMAVELMVFRGIAGAEGQRALGAAYQRIADDPKLATALSELAGRLEALTGADPRTVTQEIDTAAMLLNSLLAGVEFEGFFKALEPQPDHPESATESLWLATLFPDPAQRAVMAEVLIRRAP